MENAGLKRTAIEQFHHYYRQLYHGETGTIPGSSIHPLKEIADASSTEIAENLEYQRAGAEALDHTCIIKLNGGLGTSMGLERAKSLLEVTDGLSFLDIITKQCLSLRKQHDCSVPLLFMNSFRTEEDTLEVIKEYPEFEAGQDGLPVSFLQNKVPRLLQETLLPADCAEDSAQEWCPPGHGDIYSALSQLGVLDLLKDKNYRYAFISNADNLGAVLKLEILGYFASNKIPFMMEVADRTSVDKKGGHLACEASGALLLRESAQCPADEVSEFQNIELYKYFNTNSLWIDIKALSKRIEEDGFLKLPLIVNSKELKRPDSKQEKVFQLETAMGAAISLFEGASALRVPRTRFAPVKKTNDLLTLRSDYFVLSEDFQVVKNKIAVENPPHVELDPKFYSKISDFEKRFPMGSPSLLECKSLSIVGDVVFGKNISIEGNVEINNSGDTPMHIEDNSKLVG
ncbi:UNVERIFIED_CONTAM: hypothetical protein GTU68_055228 [Idotea baltica]|nr:hypothetical protein [Idotea baltica]